MRMGEGGTTLVENMIAAALFGAMAVAVYPIFTDAKKYSKQGDIRQICQNAVRGKLDEYRMGKAVSPAWAAAGTGDYADYVGAAKPQLNNLSVAARTLSSLGGVGGALGSNGFIYAKVRYNRYFPDSCSGPSQALRLAASPAASRTLGVRECVGSNVAWLDQPSGPAEMVHPNCAANAADLDVARDIPGFKLYVKLELATPWSLPMSGAPAWAGGVKALQYSNVCPNFGAWTAGGYLPGTTRDLYDFNGAGDGIRVTVTGIMDTEAANPALASFAGVPAKDTGAYQCGAQATVYPEEFPVRYYMSTDGRIYPVQGAGQNGGNQWILRSLYDQGGGSLLASGITSFAIHPRNLSVYVLRPGSLIRYSNCGGSVFDCGIAPGLNGISDAGVTPWSSVQEFPINPAIRYIGINFRTGEIYGMTGDKGSVLKIAIDCLNGAAGVSGWVAGGLPNCGAGVAPTVTLNTVPAGTFPMPAAGARLAMRLSGFFIAPNGDDAFVSDFTTGSSLSTASGYSSSSIYKASDIALQWPIARLPLAATTYSK